MSELPPAQFRKTKSDRWAVMAPVESLEAALAADGRVDVLKKSGDWSKFTIGSLGKPFDVDGIQMCYGYAPDGGDPQSSERSAPQAQRAPSPAAQPPTRDESEPLPTYTGGPEDEWVEF